MAAIARIVCIMKQETKTATVEVIAITTALITTRRKDRAAVGIKKNEIITVFLNRDIEK